MPASGTFAPAAIDPATDPAAHSATAGSMAIAPTGAGVGGDEAAVAVGGAEMAQSEVEQVVQGERQGAETCEAEP